MSRANLLVMKKNEKKLKKLLQQSIPFIGQRLKVLLILKQKQERRSNTTH
jgi:hypothetical protein